MHNVVDLFAGCGGLSEGFKAKGFNVLASVEWEPICVETIDANSSDHVSFLSDTENMIPSHRPASILNSKPKASMVS